MLPCFDFGNGDKRHKSDDHGICGSPRLYSTHHVQELIVFESNVPKSPIISTHDVIEDDNKSNRDSNTISEGHLQSRGFSDIRPILSDQSSKLGHYPQVSSARLSEFKPMDVSTPESLTLELSYVQSCDPDQDTYFKKPLTVSETFSQLFPPLENKYRSIDCEEQPFDLTTHGTILKGGIDQIVKMSNFSDMKNPQSHFLGNVNKTPLGETIEKRDTSCKGTINSDVNVTTCLNKTVVGKPTLKRQNRFYSRSTSPSTLSPKKKRLGLVTNQINK